MAILDRSASDAVVVSDSVLGGMPTGTGQPRIYSILADTANGLLNSARLKKEIDADSGTSVDVDYINTSGDVISIFSLSTLSGAQQAAQDAVVLAHAGVPHKGNNDPIVDIIPPTINDDETENIQIGHRWIDTVAGKTYECVDPTEGAANWPETTASSEDMDVVRARRTTTYALTGTYVPLSFDVTDIETDVDIIEHDDTNTERLNFKETGLYQLTYDIDVDLSASATPEACLFIDGSTELLGSYDIGKTGSNNSNSSMSTTIAYEATAGEYVEIHLRDTGGNKGTIRINAVLQAVRLTGKTGPAGATGPTGPAGSSGNIEIFDVKRLLTPNNSDWKINAHGGRGADTNNAALNVLRLDQTIEEGFGLLLRPLAGSTNIDLKFNSRAETGPGAARTVGLKWYKRDIPDNVVVGDWSTGIALDDIDIPTTDEFFQEDSQTLTLAAAGLTAGQLALVEITRVAPGAGTNLEGDWTLLTIEVSWS